MENPHMFDELTNRLNKVKRPDSGIHNSGEFIDDNEKTEKPDEQVDSGRDSDPAEGASPPKKGGLIKNLKKMFKTKGKKGEQGKEKELGQQIKAVSEPRINEVDEKAESIKRSYTAMEKRTPDSQVKRTPESPGKRSHTAVDKKAADTSNQTDSASDDEENRVDGKKNSLKDGPSFIRTSLRKLKIKMKKSNGSESSPGVVTKSMKRYDSGGMSPKKSPVPIPASKNECQATKNEKDGSLSTSFPEVVSNIRVAVESYDEASPVEPAIIETTAAKDKIRVAPRNRRRPTRSRPQGNSLNASVSSFDRKSSGSSLRTVADDEPLGSPKAIKNGGKSPSNSEITGKLAANILNNSDHKIHEHGNKIKDSDCSSFKESKPEKDDFKAEKIISNLNTSSKSLTTSDVDIGKSQEKQATQNVSAELKDLFRSPKPIPKKKPAGGHAPSKVSKETRDMRALSLSLGDLISSNTPTTRRTKSLKTMNDEKNQNDNETTFAITSKNEENQYDKLRRQMRENNSDIAHGKLAQRKLSKSTVDISSLNKENSRRSGSFQEDSQGSLRDLFDIKRRSLAENIDYRKSKENVGRSFEQISKSRHSMPETMFAITSKTYSEVPIIPYGVSVTSEKSTNGYPRSNSLTKSKDDVNADKSHSELPKNFVTKSKEDISTEKPLNKVLRNSSTESKDDSTTAKSPAEFLRNSSTEGKDGITAEKTPSRFPCRKSFTGSKEDVVTEKSTSRYPTNSVTVKNGIAVEKFTSGFPKDYVPGSRDDISEDSSPKRFLRKSLTEDKGDVTPENSPNKLHRKSIKGSKEDISNEKPPTKFQKKSISESKDDMADKPRFSPNKFDRKVRPLSEKISVSESDFIMTNISLAKSSGDVRAVEDLSNAEKIKPLSPVRRRSKPLMNGKKQCSLDLNGHSENEVPEFNRISLRKISKTEDFIEKALASSKESVDVSDEENSVFKSISLRKVEKKDVDVSESNSIVTDTKNNSINSHTENNSNVDKLVRVTAMNTEKEPRKSVPSPIKEKPSNASSSHSVLSESRSCGNRTSESNKTPLKQVGKAKSEQRDFPFQSHDMVSRKSEFRQKSQSSHSFDTEEQQSGVPQWIAMAQQKQRDNEIALTPANRDNDIASTPANENDQAKPPITKPKPKLLPKPDASRVASSPADVSRVASPPTAPKPYHAKQSMQEQSNTQTTSASQPTSTQPPVPVKRHSLRFNAKTDLSQENCIVCGKIAYTFERCEINNRTIHRACLVCNVCSRTLNLTDVRVTDDKVFCSNHS